MGLPVPGHAGLAGRADRAAAHASRSGLRRRWYQTHRERRCREARSSIVGGAHRAGWGQRRWPTACARGRAARAQARGLCRPCCSPRCDDAAEPPPRPARRGRPSQPAQLRAAMTPQAMRLPECPPAATGSHRVGMDHDAAATMRSHRRSAASHGLRRDSSPGRWRGDEVGQIPSVAQRLRRVAMGSPCRVEVALRAARVAALQSPTSWTWKPCRPRGEAADLGSTSTMSPRGVKLTVPLIWLPERGPAGLRRGAGAVRGCAPGDGGHE